MPDKLKKYFSFRFFKLLGALAAKGQYRLTTTNHREEPLITSVFYMDGDTLDILYLKNGELLIEDYQHELHEHQKKVDKDISSLKIFKQQLTFILGSLSVLLSLNISSDNPLERIGITGAFFAVALAFRKYFFQGVVLLVKVLVKYFSGKS